MASSPAPPARPSAGAAGNPVPPSVRLVNTRYLVRGRLRDDLGSQPSAADWLRTELASPELQAACEIAAVPDLATVPQEELTALRLLRDVLGTLFAAAPGEWPAEQVEVLNDM